MRVDGREDKQMNPIYYQDEHLKLVLNYGQAMYLHASEEECTELRRKIMMHYEELLQDYCIADSNATRFSGELAKYRLSESAKGKK